VWLTPHLRDPQPEGERESMHRPLVFFVMKGTTVRPGVMCMYKQTMTILF